MESMESQRCCAHCPDKLIARKNEFTKYCPTKYIPADMKTSSLRKHTPTCPNSRQKTKRDNVSVESPFLCCYDKFALAKRLHAENLQHQPLPDKVDDSIFKNVKIPHGCSCAVHCEHVKCDDTWNKPTRANDFGPALGCKKPKSRMDLAICWETPIDPVYEPRRPTHIDGSEGGSAPAIFALIQHTSSAPTNRQLITAAEKKECDYAGREESKERCCCDCLCKRIEGVAIAKPRVERKSGSRSPLVRITQRKCAACDSAMEKKLYDPRLTRSAVGFSQDLDIKSDIHRNGLPTRATVPRPRTPFARRSFCIDTLTPPFSVMHGCRDADYPEHWRLMSVYQQSYKNPHKRRTRRL